MVKGFLHSKDLICGILIVFLLLCVCVSVDYADEDITINQTIKNDTNCTLVNGTHYSHEIIHENGVAHIHKVVVEKPKYPIVSMWARPSVRCNLPYKWYYHSFIDYCPHCHHYGVLLKNPKGVPEKEYTCRRCGADYCAVTGKEKFSWSHYYLRRP